MHEVGDAGGLQTGRADGGIGANVGAVRRARDLRHFDPAAVDGDNIGEGTADFDADPHVLPSRDVRGEIIHGTAAMGKRRAGTKRPRMLPRRMV
jgi:hypothetical protein